MKKVFFYLIVWMALMAFLSIISFNAEAAMRGDKDSCTTLGAIINQAGHMRDTGVPWSVAESRFAEMVVEALQSPESFVKTQADMEFIMAGFKKLWDHPQEPSYAVATVVYRECMAVSQSKSKKVKMT